MFCPATAITTVKPFCGAGVTSRPASKDDPQAALKRFPSTLH
jgi:hypothetical protein